MLTVVTLNSRIIAGGDYMKTQYHHGNLKNELIEVGIKIVSEEGIEHLSLRNISRQCGVSHNAIYRHFDNKEQMVDCCREYVTQKLTEYLRCSIEGHNISEFDTLKLLGLSYINYYKEHPTYFNFLYRKTNLEIIFSMKEVEENYPPFEVFREVCCAYCKQHNLKEEIGLKKLITIWSIMHGVISLIISPNIKIDGKWEDYLNDIF